MFVGVILVKYNSNALVVVVHITAAIESMRAPPAGQTLTHAISQP